jgi:hypothetical protein
MPAIPCRYNAIDVVDESDEMLQHKHADEMPARLSRYGFRLQPIQQAFFVL